MFCFELYYLFIQLFVVCIFLVQDTMPGASNLSWFKFLHSQLKKFYMCSFIFPNILYILGQSFPDGTAYTANPSKYYKTKPTTSGYSGGKLCEILLTNTTKSCYSISKFDHVIVCWQVQGSGYSAGKLDHVIFYCQIQQSHVIQQVSSIMWYVFEKYSKVMLLNRLAQSCNILLSNSTVRLFGQF